MNRKHLSNSSFSGVCVQGGWGATSGREDEVCVKPCVLILNCIEYERQAETQLVTSELALCYLLEHTPSASLFSLPLLCSFALNETGGGAGSWAGDITEGL